MRRVTRFACLALLALGTSGCSHFSWPSWKKPEWDFLDIPALKEYRDSPKSASPRARSVRRLVMGG